LLLFLFASVERIRIVGETPGETSNQRALEKARSRGLFPVQVNFDTWQHIDFAQEAGGYTMIRYVGVAYIGNILITALLFLTGLFLQTSSIEKIHG
jgi:hypothetical protein